MRFFRAHRRSSSLLALVALLVAQGSAIAYACPLDRPPAMSAEMPCHEAEGAPAAECTAHCQAGAQVADQPKPLAAAYMITPPLAVVALDTTAPAPEAVRADAVPARATAPPLPILYHRFLN